MTFHCWSLLRRILTSFFFPTFFSEINRKEYNMNSIVYIPKIITIIFWKIANDFRYILPFSLDSLLKHSIIFFLSTRYHTLVRFGSNYLYHFASIYFLLEIGQTDYFFAFRSVICFDIKWEFDALDISVFDFGWK